MAKKTVNQSPVYSKEQLLHSKQFVQQKDLLNALLAEGEYSVEQVKKTVEEFLKREAI